MSTICIECEDRERERDAWLLDRAEEREHRRVHRAWHEAAHVASAIAVGGGCWEVDLSRSVLALEGVNAVDQAAIALAGGLLCQAMGLTGDDDLATACGEPDWGDALPGVNEIGLQPLIDHTARLLTSRWDDIENLAGQLIERGAMDTDDLWRWWYGDG